MPKMHGHHELPNEADCDGCGQPVVPVQRHHFHPQTGTVTCDNCWRTDKSTYRMRKDWE